MPILEVCSTLAFSARMSASIRATDASSALIAGARGVIANKMRKTRGRQRATERARHRCQRHHGRQCGEPALAEHSLSSARIPVPGQHRSRSQARSPDGHDHDLAGAARRVGLGRLCLGSLGLRSLGLGSLGLGSASGLAARLWASTRVLRFRPARAPDRVIRPLGFRCRSSESSCAEAATGSLCASDEWGTAGPALREPGSPLVCSAFVRSRSNSPVKVDHLVTFIACEIVTGGRLTEILGSRSGPVFSPAGAAPARTRPMLPCGNDRPTSCIVAPSHFMQSLRDLDKSTAMRRSHGLTNGPAVCSKAANEMPK